MKRWIALSGLVILAIAVAIQFIPVDTTNPPVEQDIPTPPAVKAVLQRSCYACHSNETVWPWYSRLAPLSWRMARDVREGRARLNFSTWNRYGTKEQVEKLKESWVYQTEGQMPPWYYLPIHHEAQLSLEDQRLLRQWALAPDGAGEAPSQR
jgi:hypothetical protein